MSFESLDHPRIRIQLHYRHRRHVHHTWICRGIIYTFEQNNIHPMVAVDKFIIH
jgi:hypothetical protein